MKKWTSILIYGAAMGILVFILKYFEYRYLLRDISTEVMIFVLSLLFTIIGIWVGVKWQNKGSSLSGIQNEKDLKKLLNDLGMSAREYEVLELISQGFSNQEIANKLFISVSTVKTHVSNLFSKLDAKRRTQAIQQAKSLNLLQ